MVLLEQNISARNIISAYSRLHNLPYFIVIFDDINYRETRDTEIYSFTFSMMLLFFAFLVLELFVVFLVSSKRSFFKRQLYDTSWIGLKIFSHHQYNIATLFNLVIILMLVAFFRTSTFLTYLYILLFSVTFVSVFLTFFLQFVIKIITRLIIMNSRLKHWCFFFYFNN